MCWFWKKNKNKVKKEPKKELKKETKTTIEEPFKYKYVQEKVDLEPVRDYSKDVLASINETTRLDEEFDSSLNRSKDFVGSDYDPYDYLYNNNSNNTITYDAQDLDYENQDYNYDFSYQDAQVTNRKMIVGNTYESHEIHQENTDEYDDSSVDFDNENYEEEYLEPSNDYDYSDEEVYEEEFNEEVDSEIEELKAKLNELESLGNFSSEEIEEPEPQSVYQKPKEVPLYLQQLQKFSPRLQEYTFKYADKESDEPTEKVEMNQPEQQEEVIENFEEQINELTNLKEIETDLMNFVGTNEISEATKEQQINELKERLLKEQEPEIQGVKEPEKPVIEKIHPTIEDESKARVVNAVSNNYKKEFVNKLKEENIISKINFSLLPDTYDTKNQLEKQINAKYFRAINKIIGHFGVYPRIVSHLIKYQSISIKILNEKNIFTYINNNLKQIADYLGEERADAYLMNNGKFIILDIMLADKMFISFKESIKNSKPLWFNLFFDYNRKPYFLNLIDNQSIVLLGDKGSGKSLSVSTLALSFILFQKQFNKVAIYEQNSESLNVFKEFTTYLNKESDLEKELDSLLKVIEKQEKLFKQKNVQDIYGYNCKSSQKIKQECLILSNIEKLSESSLEKLRIILQNSSIHGIYIVLSFAKLNEQAKQLFNEFDIKVCFKLNNKNDSFFVASSDELSHLNNNGDVMIFESKTNRFFRLQSVYVKKQDIKQLLKKGS